VKCLFVSFKTGLAKKTQKKRMPIFFQADNFNIFLSIIIKTGSYFFYEVDSYHLALRQCIPVTFSKSGVFSGKWDPEPPEFPVDFCSGNEVRNLAFFESPKIGSKISLKISPKIRPKGVKNDPKMTKFGLF
jgi:hypothetical protein